MAFRFWVPHSEHVWTPGIRDDSCAADIAVFTIDTGERISIPSGHATSLDEVHGDHVKGVDDICALQVVNDAALLHTIRIRYLQDIIYTRVRRTVIAINPFKALPIYSTQHMAQYIGLTDSLACPPHIFSIGHDAVRGLKSSSGKNQAILISGESGAGKTECAKLILSFIAEVIRESDGVSSGMEERMLQANPVLEAFGNAMTVRNNNSSRFEKWLNLCFSESLALKGCTFTSYFLETVRICHQAPDERNFHVFFQLLRQRDTATFQDLGLEEPEMYRVLQCGQMIAPGINDIAQFEELQEALAKLGFDDERRMELFRIVAAVLNIGNCTFAEQGEGSKLENDMPAEKASNLLKVSHEKLKQLLLVPKFVTASGGVEQLNGVPQACSMRDGLARLIYGRLFLLLIAQMNRILSEHAQSCSSVRHLGVLDIAGFECCHSNSLDQLLINLSNDHLQQHFLQVTFKADLEECTAEGVAFPLGIDFVDNADCLSLLDSDGGILDSLDELMSASEPSDQLFVSNVLEKSSSSRLIISNVQQMGFGIKHFAGDVSYDCTGWHERNSENLSRDVAELFLSSELSVLQEMGAQLLADSGEARQKVGKVQPWSVSLNVRNSLRDLMSKIQQSDPHYVRCVKPNVDKVPRQFEGNVVLEQLLRSGVLPEVRIRKEGFTYRIPLAEFVFRYERIIPKLTEREPELVPQQSARAKAIVTALPSALEYLGYGLTPDSFAVGHHKVFVKLPAYQAIEHGRSRACWAQANSILRFVRGMRARKKVKPMIDLRKRIRNVLAPLGCGDGDPHQPLLSDAGGRRSTLWVRGSLLGKVDTYERLQIAVDALGDLILEANAIGLCNKEVLEAKQCKSRGQAELDTVQELRNCASSIEQTVLDGVLARAQALAISDIEECHSALNRFAALKVQQPLIRSLEAALRSQEESDSDWLFELQEVLEQVQASGVTWLPELAGAALTAKAMQVITAHDETLRLEAERSAAEERLKATQIAVADRTKADRPNQDSSDEQRSNQGSAQISFESPDDDHRLKLLEVPSFAVAASQAVSQDDDVGLAVSQGSKTLTETELESAQAAAAEADLAAAEARGGHVVLRISFAEAQQSLYAAVSEPFDPKLCARLLTDLRVAAEEYNVEALGPLLAHATAHGMDDEECDSDDGAMDLPRRRALRVKRSDAGFGDSDDDDDDDGTRLLGSLDQTGATPSSGLEAARRTFRYLQSDAFVLRAVESSISEVSIPGCPVAAIRALNNLQTQLQKMMGHDEEIAAANHSLQRALWERGKPGSSVLLSDEPEELALAEEVFGRLSHFSRLKPAKFWSGHRRSSLAVLRAEIVLGPLGSARGGPSAMLSHSAACIEESLTRTPAGQPTDDYDVAAIQNFQNLRVWMRDRPAQKIQRMASRDALLRIAKAEPSFRDEIYVQVLKQITSNPVPTSLVLGWDLLQRLCKAAPPQGELSDFVRSFVMESRSELLHHAADKDRAARTCDACLAALVRPAAWSHWSGVFAMLFQCSGGRTSGAVGVNSVLNGISDMRH